MKTIKFTFTVSGAIGTLTVFANNDNIDCIKEMGIYKGKFDKQYGGNEEVKIKFILVGLVGTGYEITYDCKKNNTNYVDPKNPSPINNEIKEDLTAVEVVKV